jgi:hypothetical protein
MTAERFGNLDAVNSSSAAAAVDEDFIAGFDVWCYRLVPVSTLAYISGGQILNEYELCETDDTHTSRILHFNALR